MKITDSELIKWFAKYVLSYSLSEDGFICIKIHNYNKRIIYVYNTTFHKAVKAAMKLQKKNASQIKKAKTSDFTKYNV